jgi:hypothetical protein
MDSVDNQSFELRSELGDSQTHLPSDVVGKNHHASGNDPSMEHKSADPASYGVSEIAQHQNGIYPLRASPGRDHRISGDGSTRGDAANNDDI